MAENTKYVARVPIVPDDFENKDLHKDHELVMDFNEYDIYIKDGDGYVNITGLIKEEIKEIQDGSAVIHIVTEDTLPPIKDRKENHWYYVITKAVDAGDGRRTSTDTYVYYGLNSEYAEDKNYLLISQNVTSDSSIVKIKVAKGLYPFFYIPISYGASFKYNDTQKEIDYEIVDRIYAINNKVGSYVTYDVYKLDIDEAGEYDILVDLTGSDYYTITFDTNKDVEGLVLPENMHVQTGRQIGHIPDPEWTNPRYNFEGWSNSKFAKVLIPPEYVPEESMTLFAWFEYNDDPFVLTYQADYVSDSGETIEEGE